MNTAVSRIRTQLLHELARAFEWAPAWKTVDALVMAVSSQISFLNHETSGPFELYADPLRITILQVKIALQGEMDITPELVEQKFWEQCPQWLAKQLDRPPVALERAEHLHTDTTRVALKPDDEVVMPERMLRDEPHMRGARGTVLSVTPKMISMVQVMFPGEPTSRFFPENELTLAT